MKCIVLNHEFNVAQNENIYCKLEVRPDNDVWAASFNYVMFVTEAMKDALEANFPKFIYLQEIKMKTPEPFYRVWASDGPNYTEGEFVCRPNKEDPDNPIPVVFNDIKIVIRTTPNGEPARGEDAEKLLESQWNRSIANGTIIPLSFYEEDNEDKQNSNTVDKADPFAGASTALEPEDKDSLEPSPKTQSKKGITVPRR